MPEKIRILIISKDCHLREWVKFSLDTEGHEGTCVSSAAEALDLPTEAEWNCLLLDVSRDDAVTEVFLPALLDRFPTNKVCIVSALGEASARRHAQRWKIGKVLCKPLLRRDLDDLVASVAVGTPHSEGFSSSDPGEASPCFIEELDNYGFFLAGSAAMLRIHKNIRILASVDHPVLILGESGVGKEIVARLLHKYHTRAKHAFINVNTAALPSELLESELFGYEAGAFTGALRAKPGKFELADKGSLLLDEIGEMMPLMQAKLLHVLQDGTFSRLGARSSTQVDVRILAATNVDLEAAIVERRFREDLYYRLNAFTITVPSLRERREEIPMLIEQMMRRAAVRAGHDPYTLSPYVLEAAQEYHWPGNLRELRNFVTRINVLKDEESALVELRSKTRTKSSSRVPEKEAVSAAGTSHTGMKGVVNGIKYQTESRMIKEALSASGWNRRRAATNLNISYRSLLYKIQQLGLTV